MARPDPIVDVAWVRARRPPPVLCDVRWYLDGRPARPAFEAGHLPGAALVELEGGLAAPPTTACGRHPLPAPEAFAAAMSAAGVGDATTVVAYDDQGGMVAGRLVWLLRIIGVDAALLDGGLGAWDGEVETGPGTVPDPASFTARPWPADRLVDADGTADALRAGALVLDARSPERYRGDVEPIDARAGHVPGALNAPFAANLDGNGRFLAAAALAARYAALGAGDGRDVVVYCGSGVSACHDLLALEHAGIGGARLFPGSWSQWSADPERPVAVGDEPGAI